MNLAEREGKRGWEEKRKEKLELGCNIWKKNTS